MWLIVENAKRTPEWKATCLIPIVVLSALTSELFLKTLHAIEFGRVPKAHDLYNLFRCLPPETRKAIQKKWDEFIPSREAEFQNIEKQMNDPIPRDLETALKNGSRAFETLRYHFEGANTFQSHGPTLASI